MSSPDAQIVNYVASYCPWVTDVKATFSFPMFKVEANGASGSSMSGWLSAADMLISSLLSQPRKQELPMARIAQLGNVFVNIDDIGAVVPAFEDTESTSDLVTIVLTSGHDIQLDEEQTKEIRRVLGMAAMRV